MGVLNTSLARLYAPYSASMKFASNERERPTSLLPDTTFDLRKRAGVHEAAHAIVARAYGLPVNFAELKAEPGEGRVILARGNHAPWARTVVFLAGPSAEIVFYSGHIEGSYVDFKRARQFAQRIDPENIGKVIRQAWAAAEKIVRDNRTVISCLAAVLERNGKLSGAEIDGIIGSISFTGKVRPGPLQPRATEGEICELGLVSEIEKQTHRRHCGNCGEKLADPSSEVCPGCGALIVAFDDIRLGEAQ
jgi:hypothetical protein